MTASQNDTRKIIEYLIFWKSSPSDLVVVVNEFLSANWSLYGDLFVRGDSLYQAMVKYDCNPE